MRHPLQGMAMVLIIKSRQLYMNEPGLYQVLAISTKPLAKVFLNKYITDIMPEIRKTGKYMLNDIDAMKTKQMNKD